MYSVTKPALLEVDSFISDVSSYLSPVGYSLWSKILIIASMLNTSLLIIFGHNEVYQSFLACRAHEDVNTVGAIAALLDLYLKSPILNFITLPWYAIKGIGTIGFVSAISDRLALNPWCNIYSHAGDFFKSGFVNLYLDAIHILVNGHHPYKLSFTIEDTYLDEDRDSINIPFKGKDPMETKVLHSTIGWFSSDEIGSISSGFETTTYGASPQGAFVISSPETTPSDVPEGINTLFPDRSSSYASDYSWVCEVETLTTDNSLTKLSTVIESQAHPECTPQLIKVDLNNPYKLSVIERGWTFISLHPSMWPVVLGISSSTMFITGIVLSYAVKSAVSMVI